MHRGDVRTDPHVVKRFWGAGEGEGRANFPKVAPTEAQGREMEERGGCSVLQTSHGGLELKPKSREWVFPATSPEPETSIPTGAGMSMARRHPASPHLLRQPGAAAVSFRRLKR